MPRTTRSADDRIKQHDLTLEYKNDIRYDHKFWLSHDRRHILVGYLVIDQQCENPLDSCEGMGAILRADRRTSNTVMAHIGRTSDGERILDAQYAFLARLRGYDSSDDMPWSEEVEVAAKNLWDEAQARGQVGTPFARALVECSYNGGYREADSDDADRGRVGAVWVPDKALEEHLLSIEAGQRRADEAKQAFLNALETYNRWAEGDCWGYVVEHFQKGACGLYHAIGSDSESCWGYIGNEWAENELVSVMKHFRKSLILRETKRSPKKICSQNVEKTVANHA